jgi:hypothetical protein
MQVSQSTVTVTFSFINNYIINYIYNMYLIHHISAEAPTTGRVIRTGTNSPPAEVTVTVDCRKYHLDSELNTGQLSRGISCGIYLVPFCTQIYT